MLSFLVMSAVIGLLLQTVLPLLLQTVLSMFITAPLQTIAGKVRHLLVNAYQNSLHALKVLRSRLLSITREALKIRDKVRFLPVKQTITKLQEILPQLLPAIRTGSSVTIVLYTWIEFRARIFVEKNYCSVAWKEHFEYLINIDDRHTVCVNPPEDWADQEAKDLVRYMASYFIVLMLFWSLLQYISCTVLAWLVRLKDMELHERLAHLLLSILWAIQFVLPPTIAWGCMIAMLTNIESSNFCTKKGYDGIYSPLCLTQLRWDEILGPRLYWGVYVKAGMGFLIGNFILACIVFSAVLSLLAVLFFLILSGLYYVLTMMLTVCRLFVCLLDPVVSIFREYHTALQQGDSFFLMREKSLRPSTAKKCEDI